MPQLIATRTTGVVTYPSAVLPGIPPFVFAVPKGWVLEEGPGALAVLRLPEEFDGFHVNAILSHARVARSVDFKRLARSTWARLLEHTPDAVVEMEKFLRAPVGPIYVRTAALTSPAGRSIAQLHAIFFAPTSAPGTTADCFQLVVTVPKEHADRFGPSVLEILLSFRFC